MAKKISDSRRFIIGSQEEADGRITYYININKKLFAPILDKPISIFINHSRTVDEVCGTMQTFDYGTLGTIIHQIDAHIRKAGLRKIR